MPQFEFSLTIYDNYILYIILYLFIIYQLFSNKNLINKNFISKKKKIYNFLNFLKNF